MKILRTVAGLLLIAQGGIALAESKNLEGAVTYDPVEQMTLSFVFHIDDGMAEQDVFYEKVPGSGEVFRPTAATREMDAPLYAPAVEVPHNFLDTSDTGPYPKGPALGLRHWPASRVVGRS